MKKPKPTYEELKSRVEKLEAILDIYSKPDATEHYKQDEDLYEKESLFKISQRVAKIGSWNLDLITRRLYWSDQTYWLFDKELNYVPSFNDFARLVHPDDSGHMHTCFNAALQNDENPYHVVVRIINDSKREWIMEAFGTVKRDKHGKAINISGTAQDVTERIWGEKLKEKNAELIRAKQFAENIIQTANTIVIGLDVEGNITIFNEAAEKITGYSRSELEDKNWFDAIVPKNRFPEIWSIFSQISKKGFPREYQNPIHTKSGEERIIVWQNSHMHDNGDIVGTISFGIDITEQKKAESELLKAKKNAEKERERLNFVLEGSKLGFWDWDIVTDKIQRNNRWADILGYSQEEIGTSIENWKSLIHPDDRENVLTSLKNHLNGETPSYHIEYRMLTKDYHWKWLSDTAMVVERNKEGKPLRMSGTHTDITERKQNEEKINKYTLELKELNATKDKFFSIIAHDLRSPMNSILGFCELLESEGTTYTPEEIQKTGSILYEATKQTYSLLNSLLEWAQLQIGNIKPEFSDVVPSTAIQEVFILCEPFAQNKNISLTRDINFNESIKTDFNMLKTILRNLVSNALKYTLPKGNVTVRVGENNNNVLFSVTDNGTGIEKKYLDKLFRIDNQLSRKGTANEKGTGLGLILCREFINKLNGDIWAESVYGKGSMFCFSIPKNQQTTVTNENDK